MLDYRLVEAFGVVIKEGGFEKAARILHVTQGAVSQRIKLLEEQTGCILLVRSSPPRPTRAGKELLKHYRQVKQLEMDLGPGFGQEQSGFTTLPVGINADSLATWFFPAVEEYLNENPVLLDLAVDDQAETHRLMRDGEVLGCISDRSEPFQGCRVEELGYQDYTLYCSPEYKSKWFSDGLMLANFEKAPMLIFNRKDVLHNKLLTDAFGTCPKRYTAFYLPSSERFPVALAKGWATGMIPYEQAEEFLERGELVELVPGHYVRVRLHWHCWNIESGELKRFTEVLVKGARRELGMSS